MLRKSLHHGAYRLGSRVIILLRLAEIKRWHKLKETECWHAQSQTHNSQTFGYAQPPLIPIGRQLKYLFERILRFIRKQSSQKQVEIGIPYLIITPHWHETVGQQGKT